MNPLYANVAVLYSFEQKAFHVETLLDYCKSNLSASVRKKSHQYRLVGIAETYPDADKIIEQLRSKFNW